MYTTYCILFFKKSYQGILRIPLYVHNSSSIVGIAIALSHLLQGFQQHHGISITTLYSLCYKAVGLNEKKPAAGLSGLLTVALQHM